MYVLHHLNNSRSQRILWLMEELGLDYELRRYDRDPVSNLAPPELAEVHPLGKSPVLEDGDRVIAESAAIVEVLCRRHGAQMLPEPGSDAEIAHHELMHFAEGSAMTPILLNLYVGRLGDAAEPLRPRIDQQLHAHFSYMESVLRPSGHFVLDDVSAADIMLSFPAEIASMGEGASRYPKLAAFVKASHERPAWQRAHEKGGVYRFA